MQKNMLNIRNGAVKTIFLKCHIKEVLIFYF